MRKANFKDLEKVSDIVEEAKKSLKNDGVDQWQNGTPNLSLLGQQVSRNNSYVYEKYGEVLAYAYLSPDYDPTYASVRKAMKGDNSITIHTLCVNKDKMGKGIGSLFFEQIKDFAVKNNKDSLRIDTHKDNFRMRGLIKKFGFSYIGIIYINDNGIAKPRYAYELLL
jgi:possible acetyltransferase